LLSEQLQSAIAAAFNGESSV